MSDVRTGYINRSEPPATVPTELESLRDNLRGCRTLAENIDSALDRILGCEPPTANSSLPHAVPSGLLGEARASTEGLNRFLQAILERACRIA